MLSRESDNDQHARRISRKQVNKGHGGADAYLRRSMDERQGTPWTDPQSIAEQHRTNNHAHTHSQLWAIESDQLT
ncbi:hypothetical protein AMECASPLE_031976 [Ameca splendens]|uniref:Uncharacterized protein n=1 Tax=Ameca splendens TaxID=208324 RepID=A0ABV0XVE2_9TELE